MIEKKKYKSIFSFATLQFDGHYLRHLIDNSEKLVALYLLPRGGGIKNFIEMYQNGTCIQREQLISPKNVLLSYVFYYLDYLYVLIKYFRPGEHFYVLNFFPFFFFFGSLWKRIWNMEMVYWIGDYWPMASLYTNAIRSLTHYYHDRAMYTFYLSDRINKVLNYGKIIQTPTKRTVMWGINPPVVSTHTSQRGALKLCFIGVLAEWQGIDLLLEVVSRDKNIQLTLIGTGKVELIEKYKTLIKRYHIEDRVSFPNKFYYGQELHNQIKDCHVGVALYKTDPNTVTYFADPAKIKQYAEFGLPVIMTDASHIASYINRFSAGIIVKRNIPAVLTALKKMRRSYKNYLRGLNNFNHYFDFRSYYSDAFRIMES